MKRLAATAITLMMTAAIGTAAASPFDHSNNPQTSARYRPQASSYRPQNPGYNAQASRYAYNRGGGNVGTYTNTNVRYRSNVAGGRWDGHDYDGDGRWNRYQYRPRGYYGYGGYGGYRPYYYPTVSVAYYGGPAYYPAYYSAPYAYDNGPYAYGDGQYAYDNGQYAYGNGQYACDPRGRYDDGGGKIVGALIGGVLGNKIGRASCRERV